MEIEPTVIPDYHIPWLERIKDSLVQSVPEEIAICEFSCDTNQCSPAEWKRCLRRLAALSEREAASSR